MPAVNEMQYIRLASDKRCCMACQRKINRLNEAAASAVTNQQFTDTSRAATTTTTTNAATIISTVDPIETYKPQGLMALIIEQDINAAMRKGFFQQIRVLVRLGCDVNARDSDGRTPLMNCALVEDSQWSVGIARLLLEHGGDPTLRDTSHGLTVLHYACIRCQQELVLFLLKSAPDIDLTTADRRGNTPLHYAAATGNQLIVAAILAACARYQLSLTQLTNKSGQTALQLAYLNEHSDCCNTLMSPAAAAVENSANSMAATSSYVSEITSKGKRLQQTKQTENKPNATSQPTGSTGLIPALNGIDDQSNVVDGGSPDNRQVPTLLGLKLSHNSNDSDSNVQQHNLNVAPSTPLTATSARQRRLESRSRSRTVADMVNDQLRSARSLRPETAVRASRRMMTKTTGTRCSSDLEGKSATSKTAGDQVIPPEVLNARRLKSAPPGDPRNHPFGNIIRASAAEFFNCRDKTLLPASATLITSQSVKTGNGRQLTSSGTDKDGGIDWRERINNLYVDYDYQFTTSYRRSAAPPVQGKSVTGNDDANVNDDDRFMTSDFRNLRGPGGGRISTIRNAHEGAARKKSVQTMLSSSSSSTGMTSLVSAVTGAANPQRMKKFSPGGLSGGGESQAAIGENGSPVRPKSGRFATAVNAAAAAAAQKRKTIHLIGDGSGKNPLTTLLS